MIGLAHNPLISTGKLKTALGKLAKAGMPAGEVEFQAASVPPAARAMLQQEEHTTVPFTCHFSHVSLSVLFRKRRDYAGRRESRATTLLFRGVW